MLSYNDTNVTYIDAVNVPGGFGLNPRPVGGIISYYLATTFLMFTQLLLYVSIQNNFDSRDKEGDNERNVNGFHCTENTNKY